MTIFISIIAISLLQSLCALHSKTSSIKIHTQCLKHIVISEQSILPDSLKANEKKTQIIFLDPGFSAMLDETRVNLNWATMTEKNNHFFTVQRSRDGEKFEKVCTSAAAGNSSTIISYKEIDYAPYTGLSYYRLVITDKDGNNSYSAVISVTYNIEKKVKSVTRPVTINDNAKYSVNDGSTLLLLRDKKGQEHFSTFIISEDKGAFFGIDLEKKTIAGKYEIVGTSNKAFYGKKITVE